jgi:hypothetical protein
MLDAMVIREATDADWPAIWSFMSGIVAAGETASSEAKTIRSRAIRLSIVIW